MFVGLELRLEPELTSWMPVRQCLHLGVTGFCPAGAFGNGLRRVACPAGS